MAKIIISLLLIASIAGIATTASSTSVPGDPLYPFKVYVVEPIGQVLSFTQNEKVAFSTELAQNRLTEFQTLVQNHTLTSANEVSLMSAFDTQFDDASSSISALVAKGDYPDALQATANFQTMLSAQVAALTSLGAPAISHLQATLDTLSALNAELSAKITK